MVLKVALLFVSILIIMPLIFFFLKKLTLS